MGHPLVTVLAQRDAAAAALGDECSNNRGAVQKTEAPQKPRKEDDDCDTCVYVDVCVFVCVCVCLCARGTRAGCRRC